MRLELDDETSRATRPAELRGHPAEIVFLD